MHCSVLLNRHVNYKYWSWEPLEIDGMSNSTHMMLTHHNYPLIQYLAVNQIKGFFGPICFPRISDIRGPRARAFRPSFVAENDTAHSLYPPSLDWHGVELPCRITSDRRSKFRQTVEKLEYELTNDIQSPKKSLYVVWWFLSLLLLTSSASTCLQHSPNHVQSFFGRIKWRQWLLKMSV